MTATMSSEGLQFLVAIYGEESYVIEGEKLHSEKAMDLLEIVRRDGRELSSDVSSMIRTLLADDPDIKSKSQHPSPGAHATLPSRPPPSTTSDPTELPTPRVYNPEYNKTSQHQNPGVYAAMRLEAPQPPPSDTSKFSEPSTPRVDSSREDSNFNKKFAAFVHEIEDDRLKKNDAIRERERELHELEMSNQAMDNKIKQLEIISVNNKHFDILQLFRAELDEHLSAYLGHYMDSELGLAS